MPGRLALLPHYQFRCLVSSLGVPLLWARFREKKVNEHIGFSDVVDFICSNKLNSVCYLGSSEKQQQKKLAKNSFTSSPNTSFHERTNILAHGMACHICGICVLPYPRSACSLFHAPEHHFLNDNAFHI